MKSLIARICDFWALSPIPRMRISSIIRVRSGLIFSSVMETSCPIEKPQSSGGMLSSQNEHKYGAGKNANNKRHCRKSGLVLGPSTSVHTWLGSSFLRHRRMAALSPLRECQNPTARACSTKYAASALSPAPRHSGKTGHSCKPQRK